MLCSVCKKNMAVIFINKLDKDGKPESAPTGLCIKCAKEQGIDPLSNIMNQMGNMSDDELNNMSEQFESMLGDTGALDMDSFDTDENGNAKNPFSIAKLFGFTSPNNNKEQSKSQNNKNNTNTNQKSEKKSKKNRQTKYLDTFGENLTKKARENKLDKVIGRKTELERLIQILNRRSKNNPALIGEPGVGKTAIVNALALAIASGNVPGKLINKEVYLIDMTSLVAGTQFRGQFEARIKGLIDECKSFGNIILAIDEVHNIVGGLEHDNSMNAANMLKPALANGSVQLIGATTLKEYRQYIEKDTALERRFQPIIVDEPSKDDCIEILKGIKEYYENYHKVTIPDDIINQAVYLSDKYIHDRFLPDKAIDLIDEACARVNLENVVLAQIEKLQAKIEDIEDEELELEENMQTLKDADLENGSGKDLNVENYEKAAKLKESKCKIETKINLLEKKTVKSEVNFDHLARVIELWTKIPVTKIKESETKKLLNLQNNLNSAIIGQSNATFAISNAILRKRSGIIDEIKPPSFIFVGPTGVGKTALVKRLAYELFDTEESVIKLDMSEYMESHSVSKLIGSPPGYVGYDDAGQLTEKVRRNPYSIILFDEIEKAHPSVSNMLLQILDEGKLTDSQGRSVSFKHTIIILTSNLGTNFKSDNYGFTNTDEMKKNLMQNKVNDALKEYFSPEFLNRIDDIVVFNKLSNTDICKIASLMLDELKKQLNKKNILMNYNDAVLDFIVKNGYNDKFGARPLKRAIQKYIEDLIAIEFIKGNIKENKEFLLDVFENKIIIK